MSKITKPVTVIEISLPVSDSARLQCESPTGLQAVFLQGHAFVMKGILTAYRLVAMIALIGVLIGVVGYTCMLGFYMVNTTWVAPTIVNPQDDTSLDFTQRLLTLDQTMQTLQLDIGKTSGQAAEMRQHIAALEALKRPLTEAIQRERAHDQVTGQQLDQLDHRKLADNARTDTILTNVADVEAKIDKELTVGLITKGEAAIQTSQLNAMHNASTDSAINEVLMQDQLLQKQTTGTQILDVLDKQAELDSEINTLRVEIAAGEKQIDTEAAEVKEMQDAMALAKKTANYVAVASRNSAVFAFVPYDNKSSAVVGAGVYDCYLNCIACRNVGTVTDIFPTEIKAQNPLFKTDMRGFAVQLTLTYPTSAKSRTLFLGSKPLLF